MNDYTTMTYGGLDKPTAVVVLAVVMLAVVENTLLGNVVRIPDVVCVKTLVVGVPVAPGVV